jgi:transposase
VNALFEADLRVARVSGYRARQYARAKGLLAKTDPLDAMNLADYGKHVQPRLYEAKSEQGQCLSGKLARRRQLGEMLKAEKNRLRLAYGDIGSSMERVIEFLQSEMKHLDEEIRAYLDNEPEWLEQEQLLRSVLYMSALTGIRYNPVIKKQYDGLVARGKVKKVAITACMRKLLTILNAMMRDGQPFRYPSAA